MIPVLEAVPNFSEGRDAGFVRALTDTVSEAGAEVLDVSSDRHHHRTVLTYIGAPAVVEEASVRVAVLAAERIDLRSHEGVHPRVGALDVLPFVPLHDLSMAEAVAAARRVGRRLQAAGIPVFLYGRASDPVGRTLAPLRRGGFEALQRGFPDDRMPDFPRTVGAGLPHPTAGATCVGARDVLLAWNVFVRGVDAGDLAQIAVRIRETSGGFRHLRALAFTLGEEGPMQISMNLENAEETSPVEVFEAIESQVKDHCGEIVETEVIGMIPDALVLTETRIRLKLLDAPEARFLSKRVATHVAARARRVPAAPESRVGDGV